MIFNSIEYIIFFILTIFIFYLVKPNKRWIVLLISSIFFYAYSSLKGLLVLLPIIIITYFSGKLISKNRNKIKKRLILMITILLCITNLLVFKYSGFIIENINYLLKLLNLNSINNNSIFLPLGISFFTLQALSYPFDIYRKDVKVEKNILKYALFVMFFPQVLSGPIGKSKELLKQFSKIRKFNYDDVKKGLLIIVYGLFLKLILADRISVFVDQVYLNLNNYNGIIVIATAFLYSLQIYFDFAGYSYIAYGSAKALNINLINNFNSPYFSQSIKEFWRRWHISLSTWFRDYLYFPLGGSRKGRYRTYLNILIVFLVSGLWHGAAWTYIIWGLLHGIYQVLENIFKNTLAKMNKYIRIIINFILVTFAWIFFRSENLQIALIFIKKLFIFTNNSIFNIRLQLQGIGLNKYDYLLIVINILLVFVFEIIYRKKDLYNKFNKLPLIIRWILYLFIILFILVFGYYGPGYNISEFIYLGY